jgi:hypothetical protein
MRKKYFKPSGQADLPDDKKIHCFNNPHYVKYTLLDPQTDL